MSLFFYEAIDESGRRLKGELEAESERAARKILKSRHLLPRKIEKAGSRKTSESYGRKKLGLASTVLFLQQLATLTEAGMPLTEALRSIIDGMEKPKERRLINAVRQQVVEGGSLADALRAHHFDEVICNMVAAGEETGQLEAVASRLAELLERRQELKQELLSATLYPSIVLGFGILVMLFLLAVVVPQVVSVFQRTGGELPWLTQAVIALSSFLRDHGILLLMALGLGYGGYRLLMRNPNFRARWDAFLLSLPMLGSILLKVECARFGRTLGMLLGGGVPILVAMHIANQSWTLAPLLIIGEHAREELREGGLLAKALAKGGMLPHMAIQLVQVGEQSGCLDSMLLRMAKHFEREISRGLKRMLTIAEPVLVLLMALGVGALALAILLPIAEMNELIR